MLGNGREIAAGTHRGDHQVEAAVGNRRRAPVFETPDRREGETQADRDDQQDAPGEVGEH